MVVDTTHDISTHDAMGPKAPSTHDVEGSINWDTMSQEDIDELIKREHIYITGHGVILELRPVSPFAVQETGDQVVYPTVPTKWDEEKQRSIENPSDPEYLRAWSAAEKKVAEVSLNTIIVLGTKVLYIPEDVPRPEDTSWSDPLTDPEVMAGYPLHIPSGGAGRMSAWFKFIALSQYDMQTIVDKCVLMGGSVRTDVVQKALNSFSGSNRWLANNRVVGGSTTAGGSGSPNNRTNGRRLRK